MTKAEKQRRANAMLAMYRQGKTLHEIAEIYGITRERVRQILTRTFSVTAKDGGAALRSSLKSAVFQKQRDQKCRSKYGCTHAEWKELIANGATEAYKWQKHSARNRGIEYRLTLPEFWKIWSESGKWPMRGRGLGKYCLARIGDAGAYEVGNVVVMLCEENSRLYAISKKGKPMRPQHLRGVCVLYPGTTKPYLAYHRKNRLGYFATAEEAYAARQAHIESLTR